MERLSLVTKESKGNIFKISCLLSRGFADNGLGTSLEWTASAERRKRKAEGRNGNVQIIEGMRVPGVRAGLCFLWEQIKMGGEGLGNKPRDAKVSNKRDHYYFRYWIKNGQSREWLQGVYRGKCIMGKGQLPAPTFASVFVIFPLPTRYFHILQQDSQDLLSIFLSPPLQHYFFLFLLLPLFLQIMQVWPCSALKANAWTVFLLELKHTFLLLGVLKLEQWKSLSG